MAINWSSGAIFNPNNAFFEAIDLDKQATNQLSPKGYSSDFVEWHLWGVWSMPIIFEWKSYNATPEYLWLTGVDIPSGISALPTSLWYMRSAAYSIAESYGQLKNMGDFDYTNEQILEMIVGRVIALFQAEIERIEEYMNQENVVLKPELYVKFEKHLEALKYYSDILFSNLWNIATENVVQNKKWSVDEIMATV